MKKYVADGTVQAFELWNNPANLGYLAAYAAVSVGADRTILLGPPFVFSKSNINNFNF